MGTTQFSSEMFDIEEQTIDDSQEAFDDILAGQFDTESHDIQFLCGNEVFSANKLILQSLSPFWRHYFDNQNDISILEISYAKTEQFKPILDYFYSGRLTVETIIQASRLTFLATKYELIKLTDDLLDYIKELLDFDNIWVLLQMEIIEEVKNVCLQFLDKNADRAVKCPEMTDLSYNVFKSIIRRDSFDASEMSIFEMTNRWFEKHNQYRKIVKHIRFQTMTEKQCQVILRDNSNFVKDTDIVNSFNCGDHKPRGKETTFLKLHGREEQLNITPELIDVHLCRFIGTFDNIRLECDSIHSGFKLPFSMSEDEANRRFNQILIAIQIPRTVINCIQLRLMNDENNDQEFAYKAYVANDKNWKLISNKEKSCVRGLEVIFFDAIEVRAIKILGFQWKCPGFTSNAWFPYVLYKFNSSKLCIGFTTKTMLTMHSILVPLNTNVFSNFWGIDVYVSNKRVKNALIFNEKISKIAKKKSPLSLNINEQKSHNFIDIVLSQTFMIQALELGLWNEESAKITYDFNVYVSPSHEYLFFDVCEQYLNSIHEKHLQYFTLIAEVSDVIGFLTIPLKMKNVAVVSIECIAVNGKQSGAFRMVEIKNATLHNRVKN